MDPLSPQLLRFSDVALLCLRLIVAAVFFESGRRHASDPVGRAASIGLSPGVTRILGWAEMAAALGVALGGFWGENTYGWHYDLTFLVANLVILTTNGGRLVLL